MSLTASSSLHPLVTQNLVETKKFYCPFFGRGYCRESSRCNFSHDNCNSIKIPTDYCHFYLANQCLYGQDCKFRHSEPISTSSNELPSHDGNNNHSQFDEHDHIICEETIASLDTATSTHPQSDHTFANTYVPTVGDSRAHSSRDDILNSDRLSTESNLNYCRTLTKSDQGQSSANSHKKGYPLCPYSTAQGICPYPIGQCSYLHGNDCDLCGRPLLHPYNKDQQRQHREECLREHEREMELSFAVQRSKDKVCGICMDTVVEKKPVTSSRFGILEKCNHIFCLSCIRKWRGTRQFETRTIRACPECRVSSDFVVPSKYWVEDQDDKEKLIRDYKSALQSKPCRYFNEGKGDCPFAGSCFYKHAYPDGRLAKLDPPKPRRRFFGSRGQTPTVANYILWNILTSTEEDDWSNDELESLYFDPVYGITDEEDDDYDYDVD